MKLTEEEVKAYVNGEPITYEPRMPLEASEKPVDAFPGGGSYLPSLEGTKRTSGAVIEDKRHMPKLAQMIKQMEEMADAPREEYGKRQPGEKGAYERTTRCPRVGKEVYE